VIGPISAYVQVLEIVVNLLLVVSHRPVVDAVLDLVPGLSVLQHWAAVLPRAIVVRDRAIIFVGVASIPANFEAADLLSDSNLLA